MKKISVLKNSAIFYFILVVIIFTLLAACSISCKTNIDEESGNPVVLTVVETVTETIIETVEVEKTSRYTFDILKEMAVSGNYIGEPASGKRLAFANADSSLAYCRLVEKGIGSQWKLAGGKDEDLFIFDNKSSSEEALINAEAVYREKPDVFLEFQIDPYINAVIGRGANKNNIYIIAVEVPVSGFPLMGIDNYNAAVLAGDIAAERVLSVWGSAEKIDMIIYLNSSKSEDRTEIRILGSKEVLSKKFGDIADEEAGDSKALMPDDVINGDDAEETIKDILQDNPEARRIIVFCLNDDVAEGVYNSAVKTERWDPDNWIIISHGLDRRGRELVRSGIIDAAIAYFPENYGAYLIPAAIAYMYNNPVPPYIFMENAVITQDNIDLYYSDS
jgi:ribose transport system substrate-binding protein